MSIFKRNDPGEAQQASTETAPEATAQAVKTEAPAKPTPPFVSPAAAVRRPGVVPPPAAPVYSMRPPESATRFELDAESAVAAPAAAGSDDAMQKAQDIVRRRLRIAAEASRPTAAPTPAIPRRPAQQAPPVTRTAPPPQPHQAFDPTRAAQAGLLNLAWRWQEAGAPIRAIHTYMELLMRYPGTQAAAAAVADLVALSDKLANEGQFHTALAIYEHLEHLA